MVAGAAALMFVAASARAVLIQNLTQGTTLFYSHGFEDDTVGQNAATASPGGWSNTGLPVDVVVTGGSPGAFEGDNYLSTTRTPAQAGNARAFFQSQGTPGDQIHAEFMMYLPTGTDISLLFDDNAVGGNPLAQSRHLGGTVQYYNGSSFVGVTPALSYANNTWQKWEIDHTLGDSTFTVSVDGVSAQGGLANPALTALDHLSFAHNGNQTFYIDAVPGFDPLKFPISISWRLICVKK